MDAYPGAVDENIACAWVRHDLGGSELSEVRRPELLKELQDGRLRGPRRNVCHERQVLDEADGLPLRCLGGADHTPVGVVELSGLGLLSASGQRRVAPPEVGQGTGVRQPVQNLRDSGLGGVRPVPPVAGGEAVFQAGSDVGRFDAGVDVEVLAAIKAALEGGPDVPCQLLKQHPEEAAQEGACEVEPLLAEVVPIVLVGAA
mmetsp:Transcript_561/g.992  ORF Transcript_561/g.992 Transcript_561/m.992 type:complete len:202 (-) Transcript_561:1216-1821(-)